MNMIKIGEHYINLSNVTSITDEGHVVSIYFNCQGTEGGRAMTALYGQDRETFLNWLSCTTLDVASQQKSIDRLQHVAQNIAGELGMAEWADAEYAEEILRHIIDTHWASLVGALRDISGREPQALEDR